MAAPHRVPQALPPRHLSDLLLGNRNPVTTRPHYPRRAAPAHGRGPAFAERLRRWAPATGFWDSHARHRTRPTSSPTATCSGQHYLHRKGCALGEVKPSGPDFVGSVRERCVLTGVNFETSGGIIHAGDSPDRSGSWSATRTGSRTVRVVISCEVGRNQVAERVAPATGSRCALRRSRRPHPVPVG